MPRITDINRILFPVEEHPVFAHIQTAQGEKRIRVPERKAIANAATGIVLGVVSQDYRLVTNNEALSLGKRCCQQLFEEVKDKEWTVFKVDAPSTASFCHIDLIHKTFVLNFFDSSIRQEVYVPYVRVTNSYNALRALRFDVGFCRKLCSNGVVFEAETISFRYSHTRDSLSAEINFEIRKGKLKKLQEDFGNYITALRQFPLPDADALLLLKATAGIPDKADLELPPGSKLEAERDGLESHLAGLVARYRDDLGANAFAFFNALTDFASNPPANRFVRKDINAMQRAAGAWLREFSGKSQTPGFAVETYLEDLKKEKEADAKRPPERSHAE